MASTNKVRFTTPVMRMLQGDVDTPQDRDQAGNPRVIKSGPNAGQPNPQYYVGGATAKSDPAWPAFWATLVDTAMRDFPQLFPHGAAGRDAIVALGGPSSELLVARPCAASPTNPQGAPMPLCMRPDFAWKIVDGDSPMLNQSGRAWNSYEGFPGHWFVRFGSGYAPRCFHAGRYAANEQIQEKGAIKRGFFIRVSGSTEGNGDAGKPGLYLNLDMIELAGIGPEIVSGPDAGAAFGGGPGALPAGATAMAAPAASATPPPPPVVAAAPPPPPVVTADPMAAARAAGWVPHPQAPGYHYLGAEVVADAEVAARFNAAAPFVPAAPATPPAMTANAGTAAPVANAAPTPPVSASPAPAPYAGFMEPAAAPVAPAASPPPPAPIPPALPIASPTRVMLPAAGGASYESMLNAGWTDETMRAQGMMQ